MVGLDQTEGIEEHVRILAPIADAIERAIPSAAQSTVVGYLERSFCRSGIITPALFLAVQVGRLKTDRGVIEHPYGSPLKQVHSGGPSCVRSLQC